MFRGQVIIALACMCVCSKNTEALGSFYIIACLFSLVFYSRRGSCSAQ